MKAALVIMTIMGCDDSATQCHYIHTVDQSWQTVALCDAQAESYMNRHQNENYPVLVAVCESAPDPEVAGAASADAVIEAEQALPAQVEEARESLAARALNVVKKVVPDGAMLKSAVATPVHYAGEGYSWVVKRFTN